MSKTPTKITRQKKITTSEAAKQESGYCDFEWLELLPKGIVFEGSHFVFILENESKKAFLPLRFPIQSADLLGIPNLKSLWKKSLTTLQQDFFKQWNVQFQRCVFIKQSLGKHYVKVYYSKDGQEQDLELPLEKVLGLCLEAELPFYATRDYIHQNQVSDQKNEIFLVNQRWTEGRQKYLM
jgi:hypothetical protein